VGETEVKEPELALARQVIDSLAGEFDPSELKSEYRRDLRAMLEAKLAGEEISVPEPEPEAPVVDLMEALRRSVAEITDREEAPAKKKAAAKPRTRKKVAS
jgi:DNA end-binding protein Ku